MPKVPRNYKRKDYSALLTELQSSYSAAKTQKNTAVEEPNEKPLTAARRLRSSKMDNRRLKYAYSKRQMVLHDKDCDLVKNIPSMEFDMVETIPKGMTICQKCYRIVLIRNAIGDDAKRIPAYLRFFDMVEASNSDLYTLLVEYRASIRWENSYTLTIKVNDDSWQIVHMERGENLLYHNNYYILEDYSRNFLNDYHEQRVNGTQDFHHYSYIICHYSWAEHVESMKERARRQEEEARRAAEPICNYMKLQKFSLFYAHYIFVDSQEHLADALFLSQGIQIHWGKEFAKPGISYRFRFCKVRKRQEKQFLEALQKLQDDMPLSQYLEYASFCKSFSSKSPKVRAENQPS